MCAAQAARDIQTGESHAVLLHSNYQVFTWGAGSFGRLGHGGGPSGKEMGRGDRDIPSLVEAMRGHRIVKVRVSLCLFCRCSCCCSRPSCASTDQCGALSHGGCD